MKRVLHIFLNCGGDKAKSACSGDRKEKIELLGGQKSVKKYYVVVLLVLFAVSTLLSGCGSTPEKPAAAPAAQKFVYKLGHVYAPDHPFNAGMKEMADSIKAKSNGRLEIQVYPAAQLGSEKDMGDSLSRGLVDLGIIGPGELGKRYKPVLAFDGPYTFRDADHAVKVARGDIGKGLWAALEKESKIKTLDTLYYGTRWLTTSKKEVKTPEDMKGLKIRVPDQPMSIAIAKAMGASPTPMALSEAYLALSQGVADGQENPIATIVTQKFLEVQKYLVLTGHVVQMTPLVINADKFAALPADLQKILTDEVKTATDKINAKVKGDEGKIIDDVRKAGKVTVVTPDGDAFRKATRVVVDDNKASWGPELYDKIQAVK